MAGPGIIPNRDVKIIAADPNYILRRMEKHISLAGPQEDLVIAQAVETIIKGFTRYLKEKMTTAAYKKVMKSSDLYYKRHNERVYDTYMINDDKYDISINHDADPVTFRVSVKLEKFFPPDIKPKGSVGLYFSDKYPYSSSEKDQKAKGMYLPGVNVVWVKVHPQYLLFSPTEFTEFWKVLDIYRDTIVHELTHWIDTYRSQSKALKRESHDPENDYSGYANETIEVNARYMEAVSTMLSMMFRLLRVEKLSDEYPTPQKFMELLTKKNIIPELGYYNPENRKRMIKRWYKLYDELNAIPTEEFLKLKDRMRAKRWVGGHITRMKSLEKNAPRVKMEANAAKAARMKRTGNFWRKYGLEDLHGLLIMHSEKPSPFTESMIKVQIGKLAGMRSTPKDKIREILSEYKFPLPSHLKMIGK